jgi:beta-glucosidase-like glycosyl hydrolase
MANTKESAKHARKMHPDYYSASVDAVVKTVDREMMQRERAEKAEAELAQKSEALNEAQKDARARSMYDRSASAHGFVNAPQWEELHEQTRDVWRNAVLAKDNER